MAKDPVTITSIASLTGYVEERCTEGLYLFRGQQLDEPWPLVPALGRGTPNWKVRGLENRIFSEFKRRSPPHLAHPSPDGEWDLLALAQHFRLATRLLDWTDNPLAALWFAVEKGASVNSGLTPQPGVIWVLHVFDEDIVTGAEGSPFSGERTQVFQPKQITPRIVAQGAWFTVHKFLGSEKGFLPLEKIGRYKNRLESLSIPPKAFGPLKEQLDRCGVNAASLFPDMVGLCDYLNSKYLPYDTIGGGPADRDDQ